MATMASRPVKTRVDDYFFAAMSVVILGTVVLGFARTYYLAGTFRAPLPSVLIHVHAVVFSSWIVLLIAQTSLASVGRIGWHRKLGVFGAVMVFVMAFVGVLAAIDSQRRHFAVPGLDSSTTLAIQLSQLAVFAILATWGIRSRRDGPAHKRLMLLATIVLMGPAINRWPFAFIQNIPSTTGLIIDAFLLSVAALDLLTRRRIHRVTLMGGLLIFVMIPAMFALGRTGVWLHFTHWVQQ
jgi:hypothetical protein